jgi:hypothetical protein
MLSKDLPDEYLQAGARGSSIQYSPWSPALSIRSTEDYPPGSFALKLKGA